MADFTKNISNTVGVFGPASPTLWGLNPPNPMIWGVSKWGDGSIDLVVDFGKSWGESVALSEAISDLSIGYFRTFVNPVTVDSETVMETLSDGSGYSYVFIKPTTDAENRNLSSYTSSVPGSVTYASHSVGAIVWS